ncbi:alpha/beta hydrolase [Aestuariimicrobium ganziense]|uniref:alpha/beta hydrolase n=1 Tax=Aestuariimicrobium ganziense TaxID=2773677 RepID=UPI00194465B0|nr:alpha/beta hydrolase [Aestuariimicrobium ganziense]
MPLNPLFAAREAEAAALGPNALPADVEAITGRPYGPGVEAELDVRERSIDGPHGPIPLRIYSHPSVTAGANRPGLVWCHGGAFMFGDLDMPEADQTSRGIADRLQGVVVSVDYRLTGGDDPPLQPPVPESLPNQYPVGHDDVHAAWLWVVAHAHELGLDPDRIAFGGASAGANLSAGAVVRLRDEGGPLPHAWLPIYPAVHVASPERSDELAADLAEHNSGFTPEAMAFVGECYGATADDPYGYIGERDDLQGLPRCLVINDQYDELRGSGEALARSLEQAGVEVTCETAEGMKHGHLNLLGHPVTMATLDRMAQFIAD